MQAVKLDFQIFIFKEEKNMEFVTLNNGVKMSKEGFGVFQVPDTRKQKKQLRPPFPSLGLNIWTFT